MFAYFELGLLGLNLLGLNRPGVNFTIILLATFVPVYLLANDREHTAYTKLGVTSSFVESSFVGEIEWHLFPQNASTFGLYAKGLVKITSGLSLLGPHVLGLSGLNPFRFRHASYSNFPSINSVFTESPY